MEINLDLKEFTVKRIFRPENMPRFIAVTAEVKVGVSKPKDDRVRSEIEVELDMRAESDRQRIMKSTFAFLTETKLDSESSKKVMECYQKGEQPPQEYYRPLMNSVFERIIRILFPMTELMHIPPIVKIPTFDEMKQILSPRQVPRK